MFKVYPSTGKDRQSSEGKLGKRNLFNRDDPLMLCSFNEGNDSIGGKMQYWPRKEFSFEKVFMASSSIKRMEGVIEGSTKKQEKISYFEDDFAQCKQQKMKLSNTQAKPNEVKVEEFSNDVPTKEVTFSRAPLNELSSDVSLATKHLSGVTPQEFGPAPVTVSGVIVQSLGSDDFISDSEEQANSGLYLSSQDLERAENSEKKPVFGKQDDSASLRPIKFSWFREFHFEMSFQKFRKERNTYVCKICGTSFTSGCALGGHISKTHRGVNFEYGRRMQARQEQKHERNRTKFLKNVILDDVPKDAPAN